MPEHHQDKLKLRMTPVSVDIVKGDSTIIVMLDDLDSLIKQLSAANKAHKKFIAAQEAIG